MELATYSLPITSKGGPLLKWKDADVLETRQREELLTGSE